MCTQFLLRCDYDFECNTENHRKYGSHVSKYWVCLIGARILKTVDVIDLEFVFANGRFGRFGRPAEPPAPKAEGLADFGMILVSIWKL